MKCGADIYVLHVINYNNLMNPIRSTVKLSFARLSVKSFTREDWKRMVKTDQQEILTCIRFWWTFSVIQVITLTSLSDTSPVAFNKILSCNFHKMIHLLNYLMLLLKTGMYVKWLIIIKFKNIKRNFNLFGKSCPDVTAADTSVICSRVNRLQQGWISSFYVLSLGSVQAPHW